MKKKNLIFLVLIFSICFYPRINAQTDQQKENIARSYDKQAIHVLQSKFENKLKQQKEKLKATAKQRKIPYVVQKDGKYAELQKFLPDGTPLYYTTYNVDASRSTRADHLNSGGSLGLNLMGQNMTAYVWDGGHARSTHVEYDGAGGSNRFTSADNSGPNFHAAHVTGTIIASGANSSAKGMAPHAKAIGYDWNNDTYEATGEASDGMLLSNHSYGVATRNPQTGQPQVPGYYFGGYVGDSRDWDELAFNAPYYLMVVAAGNDGNDNTVNPSPLNGNSNYDKLTGHSTSKNNLVVANAQDAQVDANGKLISVSINSSSSQGPTDDFRIKPDITGNGTGVYSTFESYDNDYGSISGTSMASPNVMGSLLLLQQHANNVTGNFVKAATLKGLALHTADDAGINGPDAIFGWGLLNAKRAAEAITNKGNGVIIDELTLANGQTYEITVNADGVNDLIASISWTDRAGSPSSDLNSSTPVLINDLDIRVIKNVTTHLPWRLTSVNTNDKSDNNVDPFERIEVVNASGTYTIRVTHKGSLEGGSQDFSLILTGLSTTPVVCNATIPEDFKVDDFSDTDATLSWTAVQGAEYDFRYRKVGTVQWITSNETSTFKKLSELSPETNYEAQVRSKCNSGETSSYSSSITFTTTVLQIDYCSSSGKNSKHEFISRVQLETIDNVSGAKGYSDFTNIVTELTQNQEYTITITPEWSDKNYVEGYAVYIDYNKDGDFSDAGERVVSKAATKSSSVSRSFTVPTGTIEGETRMRVSMKYNSIPDPCETFDYGEVEDYTVLLQASTPDIVAPSVPMNLTASGTTQTSTNLSWNAATDNVGVTAYNIYQDGSLINTVTETSVVINGLMSETTYSFQVSATDAAGNVSKKSNSVSVTTMKVETYCTSMGKNASYEWIDYVGLNNLDNATGSDNGYGDFTHLTADVPYGYNRLYVSAGFSYYNYNEYWKIWIDFNHNGEFESTEILGSGTSTRSGYIYVGFQVPTSALPGTTRMRISMKWNDSQTACESFEYGEVEDYTVNIGTSTSSTNTILTEIESHEMGNEKSLFDVSLFPNPVENKLNVHISDNRDVTYRIYSLLGTEVGSGVLSNNAINVSSLAKGAYIIKVNDGQKEISSKFIKQ